MQGDELELSWGLAMRDADAYVEGLLERDSLVYYNEIDPYCCQWLQNLMDAGEIPKGVIDSRSITEVQPTDVEGYRQCHFFAGIAGWSLALRLAEWPFEQPIWTGSCPCQPFSVAGRGLGVKDPRHLWPEFLRLIDQCYPPKVVGEQVASKAGREWLSGVRSDLEALGYAVGAADLCAASVGTPHIRQRLWWIANSTSYRFQRNVRKTQTQKIHNVSSKTLASWNSTSSSFDNWQKLLAESSVCRMADGVPSTLDIRPRLRAYGNAIVPQLAAEVLSVWQEVLSETL